MIHEESITEAVAVTGKPRVMVSVGVSEKASLDKKPVDYSAGYGASKIEVKHGDCMRRNG